MLEASEVIGVPTSYPQLTPALCPTMAAGLNLAELV